jgi:O-acetyl-ADP-ribose deacetylase (regulator of RNase III)
MGLDDVPATAKTLRTSTAHSLRLAAERSLKTIAFPAIGTGVSGFPIEECAEIMLGEAVQHLKRERSVEVIYFVLFDSRSKEVFQRAWEKLQRELAAGAASA